MIVRLYEAYGGRSVTTLQSSLLIDSVEVSNFLEDSTGDQLTMRNGQVQLVLGAFEVLTLKLHINESARGNFFSQK